MTHKTLAGLPLPILFLKATVKKRVFIPTITRSDGVVVPGHWTTVHVSADHSDEKVATGQGTWSQKQAHKKLSQKGWFHDLPADHKAAVVLKHATKIQADASVAAQLSVFKKKIANGQNPTGAEWKAFVGAPEDKQKQVLDAANAAGKGEHLKQGLQAYLEKNPPTEATAPITPQSFEAPKAAKPSATNSMADYNGKKVIANANGKPKIFYHGSAAEIEGDHFLPAYFTDSKEAAASYANQGGDGGHVGEVYLAISNPASDADLFQAAKDVGIDTEALADAGEGGVGEGKNAYDALNPELVGDAGVKAVIAKLKSKGFDGAHLKHDMDLGGNPHETMVAFDAAAIVKTPKVAGTDSGPKEGDTKQGADGILVLKDGHWVKHVEAPAAQEPPQAAAKSKPVPKVVSAEPKPTEDGSDGVLAKLNAAMLPDSNTNAKSVNAKFNAIKAALQKGDAKSLLMMGYGTNNYGIKAAKLANEALAAIGSKETVTAGQKFAAHPSLKSTPTAEAKPEAAPAPVEHQSAPAAQAKLPDGWHGSVDGLATNKDQVNGGIVDKNVDGWFVIPNADDVDALHGYPTQQAALDALADAVAKKQAGTSAAPGGAGLAMPAFAEGKEKTGVKAYYEKVAQKIIDHAQAGNLSALEAMPTDKGNTWKGKTANSKTLLELYNGAIASLKGDAPAAHAPAEPGAASPAIPPGVDASLAQDALAASKKGDFQTIKDIHAYAVKNGMDATAKFVGEVFQNTPIPPAALQANAGQKPVKPQLDGYKVLTGDVESYIDSGDAKGLQDVLATISSVAGENPDPSTNAGKLMQYAKDGLAYVQQNAGAQADASPKEGDTKQGADGMLVFKNGRWHKMGEDQPKTETPAAVDAKAAAAKVPMPKMGPGTGKVKYTGVMKKLKEIAEKDGAEGLSKVVKIGPNGHVKIIGFKAINPNGSKFGKNAEMMAQYAKALHEAVVGTNAVGTGAAPGIAAATAPKVVSATPTPATEKPESVDGWKKVGEQQGYNPGGTYEDANGQKWYVKFPSGGDKVAKNELVATKLYALAGVEVPEVKLISQGGKVGIASRIVEAAQDKAALLDGKAKGLLSGFAADAWLANWDTVGNNPAKGYDNILIKPDGSAIRIDAGGALLYGGAGGKKQKFTDEVIELKTMLNPAKNAHTAAVFGKMSQADIAASVAKVAAISDAKITEACLKYGPGDMAQRHRLAATLIARKQNMMAQYPSAKKKTDPDDLSWVKLKKGEKIVEHGTSEWGGQFAKVEIPAKGFNEAGLPKPYTYDKSSKAWVNAQNTADIKSVYDKAVETHDPVAVLDMKFEAIDKQTGEKTGKLLTADDHPSKAYVKEYVNQVAAELKAQTQPTYDIQHRGSIASSYSRIAATIANKVKSLAYEKFQTWADKAADYLVLSKQAGEGIPKPKAGQFKDVEPTDAEMVAFKSESDAHFDKLSAAEKQACKAYTGSAYWNWNSALRLGQVGTAEFEASKPMRKAFSKAAVELPEGIILHRGIGVGGDTYKSVMGAVIQDGSFQSASYGTKAAFSGMTSQLRLHVTKGVKGMMATSFSKFGTGEREIILHPNCRYVVMSVEKKGGQNIVDVLVLPHEE